MRILGIWDGHDSGAALVEGDRIVFAANEERFSRNKLEVGFPGRSIGEALRFAGIRPEDIPVVAISTSDFAKTLTRVFPGLKRRYYEIRRRKRKPTPFNRLAKKAKYVLTGSGPNGPARRLSELVVRKELKRVGFRDFRIVWVDHHLAHAAAAVCTSPDANGLVLSLDGIGDGLSGLLGAFDGGNIRTLSEFKGRDSLGIFFEHVTNLLNMRELEDEGKVMALAGHAFPVADEHNPLLELFEVRGLSIKARRRASGLKKRLAGVLHLHPSEQFAFMAQRVLETTIVRLVENACAATGLRRLAYAGGVASNIKVNMLLKNIPALDGLHVFPHMGDGGLALGAALQANQALNGIARCRMDDAFLGPAHGRDEVERSLAAFPGLRFERAPDIAARAAGLIAGGKIVLWFQGRMEYGPRALGHRIILALPGSVRLKNELNVLLKKRVWYQPFCPSMLAGDAAEVLADRRGTDNAFMTVGYMVKDECADRLAAVLGPDGSCRPQILAEDGASAGDRFVDLLKKIRERTGLGVVLNTSLNRHGEPVVNTPGEALELLAGSGFEYLVLEDYLVWKEPGTSSPRPS